MVSATCGRSRPAKVTNRWNTTFTSIVSPSSYVAPLAGEPTKETLLTAGASLTLPSTLWPEPAASAEWVRSASVVPSAAALMPAILGE